MRMLGQLPPHELSIVLREYGYLTEADALDEQLALHFRNSLPFLDINSIFNFSVPAWRHTAHAFGHIGTTDSDARILPITHAGNIKADHSLKNGRITIRLDALRIADYPGKGVHHVLFDFRAQNHVKTATEHVRFNQTYRAYEGESAAIIGYPIFIGLGVGTEGVAFECSTLNAKNESEQGLIEFLDSDVFKTGLKLATSVQPAVAPLAAMAANVTRLIAGRHRNLAVQNFVLGLDFSNGPGGARLAEGLYVAVQIPEAEAVVWNWTEWVFNRENGRIVSRASADKLVPYNFVAFKVAKYTGN